MKNKEKPLLIIVILAMAYITIKLTCNPLFFKHVDFKVNLIFTSFVIKVVSSTFIYPLVYVISDLITVMTNRKTAILIILAGILLDGFYSGAVFISASFDTPAMMSSSELENARVINYLGSPTWMLYYGGVFGTIITAIAEILIFNKLYNKLKNFYIAAIASVVVVLVIHNPIAALPIWDEPDYWDVVSNGLIVDITFMIVYITSAYLVNKLIVSRQIRA